MNHSESYGRSFLSLGAQKKLHKDFLRIKEEDEVHRQSIYRPLIDTMRSTNRQMAAISKNTELDARKE